MITIHLQGELADYFTPQITVDVSSVAEAIAALKANFKNFANYLFEAANRGVNYQIRVGYQEIGEEYLKCPIARKVQSIRIMPVIAGAGTAGKIIAGAALIGLGFATGGTAFLGMFSANTLFLTGGALLLGGISSLFSRQVSPDSREDKKSLVFGGTSTTVKEGGRVPIVYGVALVGMYLVSAKITTSYQPTPVPPPVEPPVSD
jgi:predicted phage tail protein